MPPLGEVLYAWYHHDRIWFFRCRKCAGITYQSTMGHQWDRSARRVEKLRARLEWARTVRRRSNREVWMSGHTSVFRGCLPITRPCESRGRVSLEGTDYASIVPICGGNAETDLPVWWMAASLNEKA